MNEHTLVGFDGSADGDTAVVVMRPGPNGTWQLESASGPGADVLARLAEQWPAPARQPAGQPWGELIAEWAAAYTGESFVLDEQQMAMLRRLYKQHSLTHPAWRR